MSLSRSIKFYAMTVELLSKSLYPEPNAFATDRGPSRSGPASRLSAPPRNALLVFLLGDAIQLGTLCTRVSITGPQKIGRGSIQHSRRLALLGKLRQLNADNRWALSSCTQSSLSKTFEGLRRTRTPHCRHSAMIFLCPMTSICVW